MSNLIIKNSNGMKTTNLKIKIMNRIYFLFIIRKLKNPIFSKLLVLVFSFIAIGSIVSIQSVIANTPHNFLGFYHFGSSAVLNTKTLVKIIMLFLIGAGVLLIKDLFDYIRTIPRHKLALRRTYS